jgi:predicted transcriptional regulator
MLAMHPTQTPKAQAHDLIDQLPDDASWDDLMYRLELHASIERGLTDSEAGRVTSQEEVERLLTRTRQLPEYPHSGRAVPDYGRADLREVLERPYRII